MSSPVMSSVSDAPVVEESAPVVEESAPVVEESGDGVEETAPVVEETGDGVEESASSTETNNSANEKDSKAEEQVNLLTVPINNENDALNVIIGFLSVAQRRGVFAINESAKIFECVKKFHKQQ